MRSGGAKRAKQVRHRIWPLIGWESRVRFLSQSALFVMQSQGSCQITLRKLALLWNIYKYIYLSIFASLIRSRLQPSSSLRHFTVTGVESHNALWRVMWGSLSISFNGGTFNSSVFMTGTVGRWPYTEVSSCFSVFYKKKRNALCPWIWDN